MLLIIIFSDPLDLSLGISDIKSPTSGSEQAVAKFLSHEIDPDLVATVVPSKHFIEKSQSKVTIQSFIDFSLRDISKHNPFTFNCFYHFSYLLNFF